MKKSSNANPFTSKQDALKCYKNMIDVRKFEEKCVQVYGMGQIAGFCHLAIGQEAIPVGIAHCMEKGDSVITSYRCHGNNLACGTDPKYIFAELMGRETGVSKGKGGSMHLFDTERGFWGGHGIVGAQVSLGTGMAFANQYKQNGNVTLALMGDGAANQGQVYESMNMAKLWNLPVLYIIENNKYAMGTSMARHTKTEKLSDRGLGYGVEGVQVDGMDVTEVISRIKECLSKIRSGSGPILMEILTYRYRGHSMSDPAKYRTKDEVDSYRNDQDPIKQLEELMLKNKYITEPEIEEIEELSRAKMEEAYQFALSSSEPSLSELYTQIYCG